MVRCCCRLFGLVALSLGVVGCGDEARVSPGHQLREFEAAGASGPAVDLDRVVRARIRTGPYRVVRGDVLRLELPTVLYPDAAETAATANGRLTHTCRVDGAGVITLPDGRQVVAAGRTLAEVDAAIVDVYYPALVRARPSVYSEVHEYESRTVQVVGAVASPGLYNLRHDQMSLVSLLMAAGGIIDEGAALIRITRHGQVTGDYPDDSSGGLSGIGGSEGLSRTSRSDVLPAAAARVGEGTVAVRFQHQGPLATTGWLTVEAGGHVLIRRWLDIGSPAQREGVRREAVGRTGSATVTDLGDQLSQLAGYLGSGSAGDEIRPAVYRPALRWERETGSGFAIYLGAVEDVRPEWEEGGVRKKAIHGDLALSAATVADEETTLILPVRGLNIPLADVPLREGDSVVVERPELQYVSVLGLVGTPGKFPYPPNTEYTLAEALASAGGLDLVADPRYVCVYRLKGDGTIASAKYELVNPDNEEHLTEALAIKLRPGDVVSVEHTPRTRTNVFLDRVFRISLGLYFRPEEIWE